jgi:hypothetical protein
MFVIVGNSSFEGGVSWKGSIHSVPDRSAFFMVLMPLFASALPVGRGSQGKAVGMPK